jgi:hypothetical protein
MTPTVKDQLVLSAAWFERLPPEQWSVYGKVMLEAQRRGLQFAIGGGFAAMTYTGRWRETKDIDLFLLERDKDEMIRVLGDSGLEDYYEREQYERHWIYRSYKEDIIVDVIWAMANRRAAIDEGWLQGPEIEVRGERFRLVPAEETLWSKLYVLQHDRCDWPDGLSLLYSRGPDLNWQHLINRTGEDSPLLTGLLSVFAWLCPGRARELPLWLWNELRASPPQPDTHLGEQGNRASLLDSRPWFTPSADWGHISGGRNED